MEHNRKKTNSLIDSFHIAEGVGSSLSKRQPMLSLLKAPAKLVILLCAYGAVSLYSQTSVLSLPESFAAEQEEISTATELDLDNKSVEELQKALLAGTESFEYKYEGRPDPFVPFITEAIVKAESKTAEELTGMRKFEPGQLILVAIAYTEQGPMAMVQDSVGKGYILRKGTKIGRSGEVAEIASNTVIIKELTYTITNQKRYKTIEMSLKKEGEK